MELKTELELVLVLKTELGLGLVLVLVLVLKLFAEWVFAGASWFAVVGVVDWKLVVEILGRT